MSQKREETKQDIQFNEPLLDNPQRVLDYSPSEYPTVVRRISDAMTGTEAEYERLDEVTGVLFNNTSEKNNFANYLLELDSDYSLDRNDMLAFDILRMSKSHNPSTFVSVLSMEPNFQDHCTRVRHVLEQERELSADVGVEFGGVTKQDCTFAHYGVTDRVIKNPDRFDTLPKRMRNGVRRSIMGYRSKLGLDFTEDQLYRMATGWGEEVTGQDPEVVRNVIDKGEDEVSKDIDKGDVGEITTEHADEIMQEKLSTIDITGAM